jgi:hypothetical protein
MFHHKSKGKGKKGDSSFSSLVRSGTSADLIVVMVLSNFYLHTTGKKHSFIDFFMFVGADVHISNYVHRFKNQCT